MSAAQQEDAACIRNWIRSLPKTEVHLHIEGSLPWQLLQSIDPEKYRALPDSWREDFRFSSFAQFEHQLLAAAVDYCTSPERYHEAAACLFTRLRDQHNVRYIETSFASGMIEFMGLPGDEVAEAIVSAAPKGVQVRAFMGIHHNGYHAASKGFLQEALGWTHLTGIDLHGTETFPLESWTAGYWQEARASGLYTKAHAGEFCGPDFVRRVVQELGVTRIQHGVRAAEDPELLAWLAGQGVTLDVCPISNVKLGVVPELAQHPILQLEQAGIPCTVNTDDPMVFGNSLEDEYYALWQHLNCTREQLKNFAANGFKVALVDDDWRDTQLKDLSAL